MATLNEIVNYQMCVGCGACTFVSNNKIPMVDVENIGRRPDLNIASEIASKEELQTISEICPGSKIDRTNILPKEKTPEEVLWGPILEVYEGEAIDDGVRFRGSSGGAVTALSAFALESGFVEGVLHTGMDENEPIKNKTVYSRTVDKVLANTGSRYTTSSPLAGLSTVKEAESGSLVVGKPCDIAGLSNIETKDIQLKDKVKLKIGIFCAGVPSTAGNEKYFREITGAERSELKSLKFRGDGWPGHWKAIYGDQDDCKEKTYAESWGYIQAYRQWRCYICPDHSGEFADIAVGDPWYREVKGGETGSSMIIIRTERGREFFKQAVDAGIVTARPIAPKLITDAQKNLEEVRLQLFGRLAGLKLGGAKVPDFVGFDLFKSWNRLSLKERARSFFGTMLRVSRKGLNKSLNLFGTE